MVDRSLGEVRLARTGRRARAAGRVSAGERRSVACLLAAERARHRVAVNPDGQEVREEARRLRRLRQGHHRREEHGARAAPRHRRRHDAAHAPRIDRRAGRRARLGDMFFE